MAQKIGIVFTNGNDKDFILELKRFLSSYEEKSGDASILVNSVKSESEDISSPKNYISLQQIPYFNMKENPNVSSSTKLGYKGVFSQ